MRELNYSRVHGQIHLAAQLTKEFHGTLKMTPGELDFLVLKGPSLKGKNYFIVKK